MSTAAARSVRASVRTVASVFEEKMRFDLRTQQL